jgi:hypothetical protein
MMDLVSDGSWKQGASADGICRFSIAAMVKGDLITSYYQSAVTSRRTLSLRQGSEQGLRSIEEARSKRKTLRKRVAQSRRTLGPLEDYRSLSIEPTSHSYPPLSRTRLLLRPLTPTLWFWAMITR